MEIWIRNDCPNAGIDEAVLRGRVSRALAALGLEEGELSVWLCDDPAIAGLHAQYLGKEGPTNVISFAQREGEFSDREPGVLGDVVVSTETAARDAAEAGASLIDEVTFLLVHGILHLVGYDHEGSEADRAPEMEAKEEEIFRAALNEA